MKIKIIIPYFGKFPDFFTYFLLSAKRNKNIDFLIFSDQNIDEYNSLNLSNVEFKKVSFLDMKRYIQSKYDFKISMNSPYKLCDFKPAYGDIFEEYLVGYDYWGFCDTDIILGDIEHFLEKEKFFESNYDKFGILGHLQVYKNNIQVNTLYKKGNKEVYRLNYRNVFSSRYTFIFDEELGINQIFNENNMRTCELNKLVDDIDITNYSFRRTDERGKEVNRYYRWSEEKGLESVEWISSNVKEKSLLYVHFQKRYISCNREFEGELFNVIPNKILDNINVDKKDILELTKNRYYREYTYYKFKKKFKKEKFTIGFIKHKLEMKRNNRK